MGVRGILAMNDSSKVAIIEDDEEIAKFLKRILLRFYPKWEIEISGDGAEAIKFVGTFKPELVLLDIQLPNGDGYEVCTAIKANPALKNTKIICVSAYINDDSRKKMVKAGADAFAEKPVNLEYLLSLIKNLI